MGISCHPLSFLGLVVLFILLPRAMAAQDAPELGGFVVIAGQSTVSLEKYVRTQDVLKGEFLRIGAESVNYAARPGDGGSLLHLTRRAVPPRSERDVLGRSQTLSGLEGVAFLLDGSIALLERLIQRVRGAGVISGEIRTVYLDGRAEMVTTGIRFFSADSVEVRIDPKALHFQFRLDERGRILGGAEALRGWTIRRVPDAWAGSAM